MMILKKNDTPHQNVAACIRKLSNIFTIFERILHALSIDIIIMYVHLQYATNFIPFQNEVLYVKHKWFSVAVPFTL